jgi:FKBP-type peptidyl-prolyl cis-trans isomerase (trigger factor)
LTRTITSLALAALLLAAIACGPFDEPQTTADPQTTAIPTSDNPASPVPEQTPAVPTTDTIATVNGEEVTRAEFDMRFKQASDSYEADGTDVNDPGFQEQLAQSLVERMINELLLLQAAAEANLTPDEAEVDTRYEEVVGQFETDAQFQEALAQFNLDEAKLRENIKEGMVMDAYVDSHLENNVPDEALQPTEAELQQAYDAYVSRLSGDKPPFEEVRQNIETQARQQKISEQVTKLLDHLKAEADVQIQE